MPKTKAMSVRGALKRLGISKYEKRIFNSNSHGELFHLNDYILIADHIKEDEIAGFTKWFEDLIVHVGKTWKRPESVFQHIPSLMRGEE